MKLKLRILHILLTGLLLVAWCDIAAAPRKVRTQNKTAAKEKTAQTESTEAAQSQAPVDLPPGATLSTNYVTKIGGQGVEPLPGNNSAQPDRAPGSKPDVVVQAYVVDAFGNPILPPETPATDTATGVMIEESPNEPEDREAIVAGEEVEESTGDWLLDFFMGIETPEDPVEDQTAEPGLIVDIPYPDLNPVTRNPRLGKLVSIYPAESFGVLWLDSRYLAFYGRELLLSRNRGLDVTGVFQMTTTRDSKAIGVSLLYGEPQVGDEIIMPGPQYETFLNDLLEREEIALDLPDPQE